MSKILDTGKQYIVTIPKDIIELMGWRKGSTIIISKYPDKNILFIEEIKKK